MLLQAMSQKIDQAISFNPNFRTLVLFSSIFSSTPTLVVPKADPPLFSSFSPVLLPWRSNCLPATVALAIDHHNF